MIYIITVNDREYEEEAETRNKATNLAVKRYREETGVKISIPVLMAIARTRSKVDGRERYPRPIVEVK